MCVFDCGDRILEGFFIFGGLLVLFWGIFFVCLSLLSWGVVRFSCLPEVPPAESISAHEITTMYSIRSETVCLKPTVKKNRLIFLKVYFSVSNINLTVIQMKGKDCTLMHLNLPDFQSANICKTQADWISAIWALSLQVKPTMF